MNFNEINFCDMCNNLTSLITEDGRLKHKCNCCLTIQDISNVDSSICIHRIVREKVDKSILLINNKYLKDDNTLPIIESKNITCPKTDCESHEKGSKIKYIKYDDDDIKYIYICTYCDSKWKNS